MATLPWPRNDNCGVIAFAGFVVVLTQILGLWQAPSAAAHASMATSFRPSTVPDLSISIGDGHTVVRPGDILTYRVRVSDTGSSRNADLTITQTIPEDARFISASRGGTARNGRVAWQASLASGTTDAFTLVVAVGRTPARVLELASVACAQLANHGRPMICAAHLDKLPETDAAGHRAGARQAGSPARAFPAPLVVGVAVAGLAWLMIRRRRRKGRLIRHSRPPRNRSGTRRGSSI
jgi:uncharacterized repeat protein (TIGR01451 family)